MAAWRHRRSRAAGWTARLVFLALLLTSQAVARASQPGCDCSAPPSALAPVCDTDGLVYQNSCVAECQGATGARPCVPGTSALHVKADQQRAEQDLGNEAITAGPAPPADYNRVNASAPIDAALLYRYAEEGWRFSANILGGDGARKPFGIAPADAGASPAPGNRTVLAARLTSEGNLYLKAVHVPGDGTPAPVPYAAGEPMQPWGGAEEPAGLASRRLAMVGGDSRVEIDSSAYPYSSVGLLLGKGEDRSRLICSGTLISGRVVLTAGHCVYDTESRQFEDLRYMFYFPNMRGGRPREGPQFHKVAVTEAVTYFTAANRPVKCADSSDPDAVCHGLHDWLYDFAVLKLAEDIGWEYGWLGFGYSCAYERYSVETAGYPADLPDAPWRMYGSSGKLDGFYGCEEDVYNAIVGSNLDIMGGQSGSGVWDDTYTIRALVNACCADDGSPLHRTITSWVYTEVSKVVNETIAEFGEPGLPPG